MTTYRLTALDSDGVRHVLEFDDYAALVQGMLGMVPWHDQPKAIAIQQLSPFEPVAWSEVLTGDEVYAPNNTVWCVDGVRAVNGLATFTITNTLTGDSVDTTPQPAAEVRRRRGPIAEVRQMFADAGIVTTIMR